jgi:hypothetical protein
LKKAEKIKERKLEEQNNPQSVASKKRQEPDEEMGTLRMKDANNTTPIRSCFSITNPSEAVNDSPEGATYQRHAAKKPRGKYPKLKIKVQMAAVSLLPSSTRLKTSAGNPE